MTEPASFPARAQGGPSSDPTPLPPKRADLHCHSDASNKAAEAALNAIHCPECYSDPREVYEQARRRGMDFVTVTDHDSIEGVSRIADLPGVLVGEELTCWFPEDDCKMHVLVYGITREDHDTLQSLAANIYDVAEYVERRRIAHAVAHPIYRQNEKLERWHLERLLLLFKGFECLNGAHSALHREAFEPVLDRLDEAEIAKLSARHRLRARWPRPWVKARVGGTDDHGLLNIGRTWTEFPGDVSGVEEVLECLREGRCRPGGEAGGSAKLAHTFYSVAVRYYTRHIMSPGAEPNLATTILQTIVGERAAPTRGQLARMALKGKLKKLGGVVVRPVRRLRASLAARPHAGDGTWGGDGHVGTGVLKNLFLESARRRIREHPGLLKSLEAGLPPLGEHAEMFRFVSEVNRDITEGLAKAISGSVDAASFTGLFDSIAAVLAQQFVLSPYYFAVFHQNKERHLLRQITGRPVRTDPATMRVGLFTDTFDEVNGVARFLRDVGERAHGAGRELVVHTCGGRAEEGRPWRKNFEPLLSRGMPYYPELRLNLPPVLEVLEWADRQQFDAIHVSTPGPMGLCGWLAAKMLRVPVLATYHTDFPAYVEHLARDHRVTGGAVAYMRWLYGQASCVFARSNAYRFSLRDLGVAEERIATLPAGVDGGKFNPGRRDGALWGRLGVREPLRVLYCGRVSVEKNLPVLVEAFKAVCGRRRDVALVVAGDGPYLGEMRTGLAGLPAYFLGYQDDGLLPGLYASADLLAFPSRTDTLGQVVMEAQACGLPAVVAHEGGPKEVVADGASGVVLQGGDAKRWAEAIVELLDDVPRRQRMGRAASARAERFSPARTFEAFWAAHAAAVAGPQAVEDEVVLPPSPRWRLPVG
jgi:glycosyltransferase involved in cell wall biosynthesis/predicted metal-dependent phosphoesterase TrpH